MSTVSKNTLPPLKDEDNILANRQRFEAELKSALEKTQSRLETSHRILIQAAEAKTEDINLQYKALALSMMRRIWDFDSSELNVTDLAALDSAIDHYLAGVRSRALTRKAERS